LEHASFLRGQFIQSLMQLRGFVWIVSALAWRVHMATCLGQIVES
jgi:hypothetical protein